MFDLPTESISLKPTPTSLELTPLSNLKSLLDGKFGKGVWPTWEVETLTLELGVEFSDLLLDKIHALRGLELAGEKLLEDPVFFLHLIDVINNEGANFEYLPTPTSLELAYGVSQIRKIFSANDKAWIPASGAKAVVLWILHEEGYSEPVEPFEFLPKESLNAGQTKADTDAKKKAIAEYIKHMETL